MWVDSIKLVENEDLFIKRIMNENLWSFDYTIKVINEYKRFLFLASKYSVSPSYPVDQVWHTHILFSKDYEKTCLDNFNKFIYHVPNDPKPQSKTEYTDTKELYNIFFNELPPNDIWYDWFKKENVYINLKNHWVIPIGDIKAIFKILIKELKSIL